jgi:lipopolysaccharide heptosyltransferase III
MIQKILLGKKRLIMQRKAAVICNSGLGDAVISLVISNNFHINGWEIDTYHDGLRPLQNWFPHLPIINYPENFEIMNFLNKYDLIVVFHSLSSNFVMELIREGKKISPEKIKVLYPYPSKNLVNELYYEDCQFDVSIPIVINLERFCKNILKLQNISRNNGFISPRGLENRKHYKRVILHVKSSRLGKDWPRNKYVKLALHLKKNGFEPAIIAGSVKDESDWRSYISKYNLKMPSFHSLDELARYVYESGFMIGNDSGIGHIASSFNLPTVIISRRKSVAKFWRPAWAMCKIVTPNSLIPNIRGFRLRDRKWKLFITVKKVLRAFEQIYQLTDQIY